MKKLVIVICLLGLVANLIGADLELNDGSKLNGRIIAKQSGAYAVETKYGKLIIPVKSVAKITSGHEDDTAKYAGMDTWGKIDDPMYNKLDSKYLVMDSLSVFQREQLIQMQQLNKNSKRIGDIYIGIAVVTVLLTIISGIITSSAIENSND